MLVARARSLSLPLSLALAVLVFAPRTGVKLLPRKINTILNVQHSLRPTSRVDAVENCSSSSRSRFYTVVLAPVVVVSWFS